MGNYSANCYSWSNLRLTITKRKTYENDISNFEGTFENYMMGVLPDEPVEKPKRKQSETELHGRVAFTKTFPLEFAKLINLLNVESPIMQKVASELAEYEQQPGNVPDGFPVFVELPVAPTAKFYLRIKEFSREMPDFVTRNKLFFKIPLKAKRIYHFDWY